MRYAAFITAFLTATGLALIPKVHGQTPPSDGIQVKTDMHRGPCVCCITPSPGLLRPPDQEDPPEWEPPERYPPEEPRTSGFRNPFDGFGWPRDITVGDAAQLPTTLEADFVVTDIDGTVLLGSELRLDSMNGIGLSASVSPSLRVLFRHLWGEDAESEEFQIPDKLGGSTTASIEWDRYTLIHTGFAWDVYRLHLPYADLHGEWNFGFAAGWYWLDLEGANTSGMIVSRDDFDGPWLWAHTALRLPISASVAFTLEYDYVRFWDSDKGGVSGESHQVLLGFTIIWGSS